jgi:fatty acid desaturase
LVPFLTVATASGLYAAIAACLRIYEKGAWPVVVISGLLLHAFIIVAVHDGAHRAITRTAADSMLMNLGSGLVMLTLYAELFRRYHLVHHAHTNDDLDPLWPPFKRRLYVERRWLFVVAEFVPFIFTIVALVRGGEHPRGRRAAGRRPSPVLMALSAGVALGTWWWLRPPLPFLVGTLLAANAWGVFRHWSEHIGSEPWRESNTYRFPLGMGIGNHAAHHRHPGNSWISMALGLASRAKDTSPLRTAWGVLSRSDYLPYAVWRDQGRVR